MFRDINKVYSATLLYYYTYVWMYVCIYLLRLSQKQSIHLHMHGCMYVHKYIFKNR